MGNKTNSEMTAQIEELENRVTYLSLIQHLHEEFASTLDLSELLPKVLGQVIQVLNAEAGSIWLTDEARKELVCHIADGPTSDKVINLKLKSGTGIVGQVAESKEPQIIADAQSDERFARGIDARTGFVTRSMICAPLVTRGESLGAVQIINKGGDGQLFNEDDLNVLVSLASNAAISIKNARLYESEKKAQELAAMLDISKEITSTLDLDRVLFTIVNLASKVIPYDRSAIVLKTDDRFEIRAVSGVETIERKQYRTLERILSWAGFQDREVYIPDGDEYSKGQGAFRDFVSYFEEEEMKSIWAVPLKDEEGILGVFSVESKIPGFISTSRFQLLRILVNQVTVAIRNAQLYSQVPLVSVLEKLSSQTTKLRGIPLRNALITAGGLVLIVLSLLFGKIGLRIAGEASVVPLNRIVLHTKVGSTVRDVYVREGDFVREGSLVAVLDDEDLQIELRELESRLRIAEKDLVRLYGLSQVADFQLKQIEIKQIRAQIDLLRYKLDNAQIRTPIPGVILTPKVEENVGRYLLRGGTLCEIADLRKINVEIFVSERDIKEVAKNQPILLKANAYPLEVFEGTVAAIGLKGHLRSKRNIYIVTAQMDNPSQALKPGMTGRAKINCGKKPIGAALFRVPLSFLRMKLWL